MTSSSIKEQSPPFVSIILPVFNEERYLKSCLETLREINYPKSRYEIITVDNGSTDTSPLIAKRYADKALFLPDVNVGAVRNFGVKHAKGNILVFLDSDCLVPNNWLHQGVNLLLSEEKSVYGGNLNLRKKPYWIEKFWLLDSQNVSQRDLLGSCIFIQKDDFFDAGGFNENVTSGEDSALSNTLQNLGYKVIIDSRLGVVHLGNPTTVISFISRQIWHSENYVIAINNSLKDKMFWLILIYSSSLPSLFLSAYLAPQVAVYFLIPLVCPPTILSIKRVVRAKYQPQSITALISIFTIDNLYLIGRTLGILKGFVKLLSGSRLNQNKTEL